MLLTFTLQDLLTDITSIFTSFIGMVSTVVSTITGSPLLLFCVAVGFAGVAITMFARLVRAAKGVQYICPVAAVYLGTGHYFCGGTFMNFLKLKCGIYTFFGVPGSGKTTFAAAITKKALKRKIPVYSNVPIKGAIQVTRDQIGHYNLPCGDKECILIVDEAGIDFNNRDFKNNFDKQALAWWKLHRHYRCKVFIYSQSYEDMDKKLRDLTQQFFLVKGSLIPFTRLAVPIRFKVGINELTNDITDMYYFDPFPVSLFTSTRIFCPVYWKMFDSWDAPSLPDLPEIKTY